MFCNILIYNNLQAKLIKKLEKKLSKDKKKQGSGKDEDTKAIIAKEMNSCVLHRIIDTNIKIKIIKLKPVFLAPRGQMRGNWY